VFGCGSSSDAEPADDGRTIDPSSGDGDASADLAPLGGACSSEAACDGDEPLCMSELKVLTNEVRFVGGYCSQSCERSDDCGREGGCPIGEVQASQADSPAGALFEDLPARCLRRCTNDGECRVDEGYACKPMLSALPDDIRPFAEGLLDGEAIAHETFCVPPSNDGAVESAP
jgi:hypothetical protein